RRDRAGHAARTEGEAGGGREAGRREGVREAEARRPMEGGGEAVTHLKGVRELSYDGAGREGTAEAGDYAVVREVGEGRPEARLPRGEARGRSAGLQAGRDAARGPDRVPSRRNRAGHAVAGLRGTERAQAVQLSGVPHARR